MMIVAVVVRGVVVGIGVVEIDMSPNSSKWGCKEDKMGSNWFELVNY